RDELSASNVEFDSRPIILTCTFGFLWLIAKIVDILVVEQFAVVAMIISGVWSIIGLNAFKVILFPLLFLLFSVPMGEALVPWLQKVTADFTVACIGLSGIPVYREGLFLYLPTGSWAVIEACSGIRYLI